MKSEIIKKVIAEWLENKVFPPLIKRDAPDLLLAQTSEIIAVAGPRRAGKIGCRNYCTFTSFPMTSRPC